MFDWLSKRFSEPSTYAGLAVSVGGLGAAFDINEASGVAGAIEAGGQAAAAGMSPYVYGPMVFGGILAAILGDKGGRR